MEKINNITDDDFKYIQEIISKNWLSNYLIKKEDFICYKDWKKIISFWRIYNIWWNNFEISSLWVDETYRWKKLWIKIIDDLVKLRFNTENNLFLACKRDLQLYYKKAFFYIIENNIPEKLIHTLIRAKENNIDSIVMKYNK